MSPQVVCSRPGSHRVLRDRSPLTSTKNERRGSAKVDIKNRGRGLDNCWRQLTKKCVYNCVHKCFVFDLSFHTIMSNPITANPIMPILIMPTIIYLLWVCEPRSQWWQTYEVSTEPCACIHMYIFSFVELISALTNNAPRPKPPRARAPPRACMCTVYTCGFLMHFACVCIRLLQVGWRGWGVGDGGASRRQLWGVHQS